jgi:hypothetical protein
VNRDADAAQVVNGNLTAFEQREDPLETALTGLGDLQGGSRPATEGG